MSHGIRFDPNALTYSPEGLRKVFDQSFQKQLRQAENGGSAEKDVERMALEADAYRLSGVSPTRGQAALASVGLNTVRDVIQTPDAEAAFAKLPADIRSSCEKAWKQAQNSVIYY